MNGDEIGKLLGLMALADNRKPPEDDEGRKAMIAYWLSMLGDLSYADASEAVQAHYRESREWIMPADIRQRVKSIRADRLARTPLPAPPAELADDPERYKRALAANVERIADGMTVRKALAGPLPGEPPAEWQKAKQAITPPELVKRDPREVALEQLAEARAKREGATPQDGAA